MLTSMPEIMKESMATGQQWGAKIAKQAYDEAKLETDAKK